MIGNILLRTVSELKESPVPCYVYSCFRRLTTSEARSCSAATRRWSDAASDGLKPVNRAPSHLGRGGPAMAKYATGVWLRTRSRLVLLLGRFNLKAQRILAAG